jgi:hypothetical protein
MSVGLGLVDHCWVGLRVNEVSFSPLGCVELWLDVGRKMSLDLAISVRFCINSAAALVVVVFGFAGLQRELKQQCCNGFDIGFNASMVACLRYWV